MPTKCTQVILNTHTTTSAFSRQISKSQMSEFETPLSHPTRVESPSHLTVYNSTICRRRFPNLSHLPIGSVRACVRCATDARSDGRTDGAKRTTERTEASSSYSSPRDECAVDRSIHSFERNQNSNSDRSIRVDGANEPLHWSRRDERRERSLAASERASERAMAVRGSRERKPPAKVRHRGFGCARARRRMR